MIQNISIIKAQYADWESIAKLHAASWKENYRGIYSDDYLDNHVEAERRELWQKRLNNPPTTQLTLAAWRESEFLGFSCTFFDYNSTKRSYLDNLHVNSKLRSQGIGQQILEKTIEHSFSERPTTELYLLVYTVNMRAITFYENNGARLSDPYLMNNADGGQAEVIECIWDPPMSSC